MKSSGGGHRRHRRHRDLVDHLWCWKGMSVCACVCVCDSRDKRCKDCITEAASSTTGSGQVTCLVPPRPGAFSFTLLSVNSHRSHGFFLPVLCSSARFGSVLTIVEQTLYVDNVYGVPVKKRTVSGKLYFRDTFHQREEIPQIYSLPCPGTSYLQLRWHAGLGVILNVLFVALKK